MAPPTTGTSSTTGSSSTTKNISADDNTKKVVLITSSSNVALGRYQFGNLGMKFYSKVDLSKTSLVFTNSESKPVNVNYIIFGTTGSGLTRGVYPWWPFVGILVFLGLISLAYMAFQTVQQQKDAANKKKDGTYINASGTEDLEKSLNKGP